MGNLTRGFQEQEALRGIVQVEPSAAILPQQPAMIESRVGPKKRQPEAILTLDCAMAGAAIAAQPAEDRLDVPAIMDGLLGGAGKVTGDQKCGQT